MRGSPATSSRAPFAPQDRVDGVRQALVGPDRAEREHRRAVVSPLDGRGEYGVWDDAELRLVHTEGGKDVTTAAAVHDDSADAAEEGLPGSGASCAATRQEIVRGEDEWAAAREAATHPPRARRATGDAGRRLGLEQAARVRADARAP